MKEGPLPPFVPFVTVPMFGPSGEGIYDDGSWIIPSV